MTSNNPSIHSSNLEVKLPGDWTPRRLLKGGKVRVPGWRRPVRFDVAIRALARHRKSASRIVRRPVVAAKVARARAPRRQRVTKQARAGDGESSSEPPIAEDSRSFGYPESWLPSKPERSTFDSLSLKQWHARLRVKQWKNGDRPDRRVGLRASHLLELREAGVLVLGKTVPPEIDGARFKSRAARTLVEAVWLACVTWRHSALLAKHDDSATLAGCVDRTVQRAWEGAQEEGWVEIHPGYRPGGRGRDGREHRYLQVENAYTPGPRMRDALAAYHCNLELRRNKTLGAPNKGGHGCPPLERYKDQKLSKESSLRSDKIMGLEGAVPPTGRNVFDVVQGECWTAEQVDRLWRLTGGWLPESEAGEVRRRIGLEFVEAVGGTP